MTTLGHGVRASSAAPKWPCVFFTTRQERMGSVGNTLELFLLAFGLFLDSFGLFLLIVRTISPNSLNYRGSLIVFVLFAFWLALLN